MIIHLSDRLDKIFKLQAKQQKNWMDIESLTDEEKDNHLLRVSMHMMGEVHEYMDSRGYKKHKIWEEPYPRSTRILEMIDIQKYLLTAALLEGVTPEEWFDAFIEKTQIVDERWKQDQEKWNDKAGIICCDIDGVLADYKGAIDQHLNDLGGTEDEAKRWIEECGILQSLKPMPNNIKVLKKLASYGYKIILVTSRRSWRVGSIQTDTINWLKKYKVPHDAIVYGFDKSEAIAKRLKNIKPVFAIDDSPKHAVDIADTLGIKVYLVGDNGTVNHLNVKGITDLTQIEELYGSTKRI